MATIGLSKPFYALYSAAAGVVTYASGGLIGKAVEAGIEIESGESNDLYADNAIAESDRSFAGGTLTLTTDDLSQAATAAILGITPSTLTVGEDTVNELIYDDDMNPPDLGIGLIIMKKVAGAFKYRAVILTKVKFNIPADAATTRGETIEWQTPEIEGVIMRDDTAKHAWKREATLDTEAEAEAYIKEVLSIT